MKNLLQNTLTIAVLSLGVAIPGWAADKPNVVMMVADNVGYGDIGGAFQGGEIRGMPTPRIDQLASWLILGVGIPLITPPWKAPPMSP